MRRPGTSTDPERHSCLCLAQMMVDLVGRELQVAIIQTEHGWQILVHADLGARAAKPVRYDARSRSAERLPGGQ